MPCKLNIKNGCKSCSNIHAEEKTRQSDSKNAETFSKIYFFIISVAFESVFRRSQRNKCTIFDFIQLRYTFEVEREKEPHTNATEIQLANAIKRNDVLK